MNWFNRETLTLIGAVLVSILIGLFPEYQSNIVEVIDVLVRLLAVILFPEAVVRSVKSYQEARIEIAKIQRLGPYVSGEFVTTEEGQDDKSTSYTAANVG